MNDTINNVTLAADENSFVKPKQILSTSHQSFINRLLSSSASKPLLTPSVNKEDILNSGERGI